MAGSRRLPGIRLRTTILATAVVAVALAVGAVLLIVVARRTVEISIEDAGVARAEAVAELARNDLLPQLIPTTGDVVAIQVIGADGELLAWSAGMGGSEPLVDERMRPQQREEYQDRELGEDLEELLGFDLEGPLSIVTVGAATPQGEATVVVASSLDTEDTIDVILEVVVVGYPVLLVLVVLVTWWVTGRALHPVESMRVEAEQITGTDLHRRLPVPVGEDEIHRLAETMNRMLGRLEESAEQQRRFVGDASHELKSPVAAMRTMLEVAKANPGGVDVEQLTSDLLFEDLRLQRIVADLVTLARSDEQALVTEAREVDLDDVIRGEAEASGRSGVPIDTSDVVPVRVSGDPERLHQLLRNVLDNALRHAATGVWVTAATEDGSAVVSVSDDGSGVPDGERERVFERFVRLDSARSRDDGGTGLGLAVARAIARAHGGTLVVGEPRHGGATFDLRLPLA